ncbi:MAG: tetratricopeptide repeat protein [Planctomycetota bacterium]
MNAHRLGSRIGGGTVVAVALLLAGCKGESTDKAATQPGSTGGAGGAAAPTAELTLPEFDAGQLPFAVQTKLGAARREARRAPNDAGKLADLAALCYVHGFPDVALACFERAAQVEPQRFLWWYYVGLTREKMGQLAEARTAYERALANAADRYENQVLAWVRIGALLLDKDPTQAAEMFRHVLEKEGHPNRIAAHYGLGVCARAAGRTDEATAAFNAALKEAPDFGPAHAALADLLTAAGRAEEARIHRDRASGTDDRIRPVSDPIELQLLRQGLDVNAVLTGAIEAAQRGRFADAEEMVRAAMDADPTGVESHNMYGLVLGMQGKLDDAVREFERVLSLPEGRDFKPAKLNLAYMRMRRQEYDQSEQLVREILAQQPTYGDGLRLFATLAVLQRDPARAIPVLEAALAAAPTDGAVHHQVGVLLLELNRPNEAKAALLKALELRPGLAEARIPLGAIFFHEQDVERARRYWADAIRFDPRLVQARAGLVGLYKQEKEWDKIEPLLREGLQVVPDSPDLANYLAWHLATCPEAARRNPAEAVELALKACAATGYQNAMTVDTLATAYAAAGRFDEARNWIAKAIDLARAAGSQRDVQDFEQRRALFEANQPFLEQ